ncbi:hypothetical protein EI77_02492 [Prosthecobacter fusiformis]|uniref:Uncharacterized protein n=1 Tax=Prosthecobacter fusiformis TaxID=48464 RepID=A0A4R7S1S1_9BACT|nr:hypothetical protein [Prosthecobacter fusiformis]TDU71368.1 hypothetical protein EI77_02492 [Prosthecobacter fusiformis]
MKTEYPTIGAEDPGLSTPEQEHRVAFYIKSFDYEFPDRQPWELEAACLQAYEELCDDRCREKLEARAREILLA